MCGTVETQRPLDDDVPQLAGRDALRRKGAPLWRGEPVVTQHRSDKVVGQHLRPERSHGDRAVPSCLSNQLVGLAGTLSMLVGDGR